MSEYVTAMGIDIALTETGWTLFRIDIEATEKNPVIIDFGVIKSPSDSIRLKNGLERLEAIYDRGATWYWEVYTLIEKSNVSVIAVETPFGSQTAAGSMAIGLIYGLLINLKMLLPFLEVRLVHPKDVKKLVAESNPFKDKAVNTISKTLVRHWVANVHRNEIGLDESEHVYDAAGAFWVYWKNVKATLRYQKNKQGKSEISKEFE